MELNFSNDRSEATVVAVVGSLNASNSESLKSKFSESLKEAKNYVFDLSEMDFVDSTGLGALVACLKHAVEKDGNIKLVNLQQKPKLLFEITRVYKIFDIYDSLDAALDSYK